MLSKIGLTTVFALSVLGGGYYFHQTDQTLSHEITAELELDSERRQDHSISYAFMQTYNLNMKNKNQENGLPAKAPEGSSVPPSLVMRSKPEAVESLVNRIEISDQEKKMKESLGAEESGRRLADFILIKNHSTEFADSSQYLDNKVREFMSSPEASEVQIRSAMDRLPASEFPRERAHLIKLLEPLDLNSEQVRSVALSELTQTAQGNDSENSVTPILSAHQLYLSKSEEMDERLEATIQGMKAQSNPQIRQALAQNLLSFHPDQLRVLNSTLVERNIDFQVDSAFQQSHLNQENRTYNE